MQTNQTTTPTPAELPLNTPAPCKACGQAGKVRNVSGWHEPLCDEHYRRRQALDNDFWSN